MGICTALEKCLMTEKSVSDVFFTQVAPKLKKHKIFIQKENNPVLDRVGIDAVIARDSKIEYMDIKNHAASDVERRHPNYAFELESSRRNQLDKRYDGWLVDSKKVTQVYAFLFWEGSAENIKCIRVCILERNAVINKLKDIGIDIENWKTYTDFTPKLYNGNLYWFFDSDIRISQSLSLPEKPMNLVVPWQFFADITILDDVFYLSESER